MPDVLGGAWRMVTPPKELLARLRWFFLLFGLFFVVTFLPQIFVQSDRPWWIRGVAAAALVGMGGWWLRCFRHGRFPAAGLFIECAAFSACVLTPSDPFKSLGLLYIAVNFRSLYGTLRQVVTFAGVATACFVAASLAAPHLGSIDRTAMLGYVLPGVPPLAVIAHLVAVASSRSVRSAARERLLARTCLQISRSDDPGAARDAALAAVTDIVADHAATVAIVPAGTPGVTGPEYGFDAPIASGGHDDGVLRVRSRRPMPDEIRSAVSLIAAQLALTLSNIRLTADLRTQASSDPLTGLANRRATMDFLAQALTPARDAGPDADDRQVGVVMIDLDGFKEVNDTLGHAAGDALLVGVAQRLQHQLRSTDMLGRLGGDEFAVIVGGADTTDDISAIAHRLLPLLGDPVPAGDHLVTVGASIGVAVGRPGTAPAGVLSAADEAMYQAKRSGRNRVCVASSGTAQPDPIPGDVPTHPVPAPLR